MARIIHPYTTLKLQTQKIPRPKTGENVSRLVKASPLAAHQNFLLNVACLCLYSVRRSPADTNNRTPIPSAKSDVKIYILAYIEATILNYYCGVFARAAAPFFVGVVGSILAVSVSAARVLVQALGLFGVSRVAPLPYRNRQKRPHRTSTRSRTMIQTSS